jgi:hypothetical protein
MNCLQRNKNGKQCSKNALEQHELYPGYCKFHINRFEAHLDVMNPMNPGNQPLHIPEPLNAAIPFNDLINNVFNENIDDRLMMFLFEFQDDIVIRSVGRNIQEQDMILFETIIGLPVEEQNFIITHYERLVELLQNEIRNIELARAENRQEQRLRVPNRIEIFQNNNPGVIQRILQAFGIQGQAPQNAPPQGELERFAKDNQNVHTSKTVEMVLETSKR